MGATDGGLWSDRQEGPADPPAPGDASGLDTPVEDLFTTAIERQVAEQRKLNQLLAELESSVAAVRDRLEDLPTLAGRLAALEDGGSAELATMRAGVGPALGSELADIDDTVRTFARTTQTHLEALRATVEHRDEETSARTEAHAKALQRTLQDGIARFAREMAEEVASARADLVRQVTSELSRVVEERLDDLLARHLGEVDRRLGDASSEDATIRAVDERVAELERSLVAYVDALAERLAQERNEIVRDVVAELTARTASRRRPGLDVRGRSTGVSPRPSKAPAAPVPVVPKRKVARVATRPPVARPPASDEHDGASPELSPGSSAREIREALRRVRGVGPAKQSALIDRFGDLDTLRAASPQDLAEVEGIGPSLARSIHRSLQ